MKKQNIISNSGSPLEAHVASSKIIVSHIDKVYTNGKKSTKAIDDVSIDIQDNDFVCIVGPSGCGKSTLLRMLAGLDFPTKGEIVVNDTPVTGPGPDRGMVFQSYTLFPWMNVEDNIKFGLRIKKLPKDEQQRIADRYLDIIGLRKFAKAYPKELSGGVKTLILMALDDKEQIFNASACGDNCAKWILKISRMKNLTINLRHIMDFGEEPMEAKILNTGDMVHNMQEFIGIAGKFV